MEEEQDKPPGDDAKDSNLRQRNGRVDTHGLTPVALAKDYSLSAFGIHPRADARRPLQEFDRLSTGSMRPGLEW